MPEQSPSQLLDRWRVVERRLSMRDPDATDFEDLLREAGRLRRIVQRTHGAILARPPARASPGRTAGRVAVRMQSE